LCSPCRNRLISESASWGTSRCCAVGPTQLPCSKAHLAAVIVDDALLAILLNVDAVPAYLPESSLPDPPSLTGPPCPLNDRNSQDSSLPSMVAGNSRFRGARRNPIPKE